MYKYIKSEFIKYGEHNKHEYKVVDDIYKIPNNTLVHVIKVKFKFLLFWITIWNCYIYEEEYLRNIDFDYEYTYQLNNACDIINSLTF